ncbi:hypothetical protein E4T56_gene20520 [Termitomyces sp. T112]|nr:hypothetical protein E4T56_gene20520 [Termitomyces sp. T112]KAH0585596.1 hypothetical protein H2248_008825 [Termitomyces sp. 'cryptogamus']
MPLEECRLPSEASYNTLYNQVAGDALQGELDFNPFAFDVEMLGVMFCENLQHMTRNCWHPFWTIDDSRYSSAIQSFRSSTILRRT